VVATRPGNCQPVPHAIVGHSMTGRDHSPQHTCSVCKNTFRESELIPGGVVRPGVARVIRIDHPDWNEHSQICHDDLNRYRARYVQLLLESERGEVTNLDREVLSSLREHELLSRNIEHEFVQNWTPGERMADRIATFGGSWTFLICFALFIALWIVVNAFLLAARPPDPYPFILLNLILSCLASVQAPIIMMSQNRKEAKDRLRSQNDYQVNLKAELEIRHLHEKMDHLLTHQWERMVKIQEIQIELLNEISRRK
jgi:uncharacterized membrane protein